MQATIATIELLNTSFNNYLAHQRFEKEPVNLYQPINYMLLLGGKRIRPLFCLAAAYAIAPLQFKKSLPAAFALEIFHNFSLAHDDIMDKSNTRRGKPTLHKKYGVNTAILSGDRMLIESYTYLNNLPANILAKVLKSFNKMAALVCEGQQHDIDFETLKKVELHQYITMITNKTAVLIATSLQIGAFISGANLKDANYLYEFGVNLGIAFQLQDDYLDTFGNSTNFGKRIGGDIVQNKKTFLLIEALSTANASTAEKLKYWLAQKTTKTQETEKIKAVTEIYKLLEVDKSCKLKIKHYFDSAFKLLEHIKKDNPEQKEPLMALTNMLINREV